MTLEMRNPFKGYIDAKLTVDWGFNYFYEK